ncbi:MobF family relaxase [Serinicoccus chungangensis]|uniref:MobF family relaxase n=1 Tax=Serinicoccus chungangensis TaxID=767452 RepID=UPI0019310A0C|nr:MobF family relaxase [Serinicoccus chungangensis]
MTLHKLAAGSGYTYLTKQVAAHDATEKRQVGLASYYEEKGEAPGRWLGTGLVGLDLAVGDVVTEEQMKLLFGQGRHPRSDEPDAAANGWGGLGRAFPTFDATSLRQVTARAFSEHNTSRGLTWNAPIAADERAVIRTQVAREVFDQRHGRPPVDGGELTMFVANASRPAQVPVAGFDLTFSPVKSVSALWALAPVEVARQVEAAHEDAVLATLAMLEREVAFTRVGKGGIRQVPVVGLVAAAFDHRDSRTGDPDLHTHVVVSNKVQSPPEEGGRWLTLDGRMLFKAKVMASEHYNTHLEAGLVDRLGVGFVDRPGVEGKRAVREIAGIDPALLSAWSSRRQAIEARQRELTSTFRADHGRNPTAIELLALAQQANLETRPDKHEPRSEAEQRQTWREQATTVLVDAGQTPEEVVTAAVGAGWGRNQGRDRGRGRDVSSVAGHGVGTLQQGRFRGRVQGRAGDVRPQVVAARVLAVLEGSRATWQIWHVRAETLRQLRTAQVPLDKLEAYQRDVQRWVLQGFSVPVGVPPDLGEPEVLRRPDGQSAHTVHGSQAYTSRAILAAEDELLALGLRRDGRQADPVIVEDVLAAQSADRPILDRSQAALVRNLATSGCRVQVALAPAGAGKTAALRVLTRSWEASGGTVLGLAPTAVAAEELGRVTGIRADTLAKYLHETTPAGASAATGTTSAVGRTVGPGTLVLIDEAGMAGTRDLAAVVRHVVDTGGSVRLVGDDQQLAAVTAGGIFRDLAEQGHAHGTTATLTELHRFTDPAEGAATLAVRDGDPAALDHYYDHDRVHIGDTGDTVEAAYTAWRADQRAGLSSLLLAATRETVRELNQRARQDRLDTTGQPLGPEVTLADGTRASAGDTIVTRRNDRSLRTEEAWVKNGDRWRVLAVHPDGTVSAERHRDGRGTKSAHVTLPATYVGEHVQLGYASTIHGAQGATVDTTHTVLTGAESRQALYVTLSRGRQSNHLYLGTPAASLDSVGPDVHDTSATAEPRQVLIDILARDGRVLSATTVEHGDTAQLLREAVLAYQDALPVLAQHHLGPERMTALDDALGEWMAGLTGAPAYPHLRGQLALRWVDGAPPQAVIEEATWYRGKENLAEANDPAAALAWRIAGTMPPSYRDAPLSWLHDVPPALRQDPETSDYLDRLTHRVQQLVERVADEARQAGASDRVPWQRTLPPDVDDHLIGDLAVWRAAHGIPTTEVEPTGSPIREPAAARYQTRLGRRLSAPSPISGVSTPNTDGSRLRASRRRADRHAGHLSPSREVPGPAR